MPTLSLEMPDMMALAVPENPAGENRDYASELIEVLDNYNINACV